MNFAAVDPGKKGAIVFFDDAEGGLRPISVYTMPYIGSEVDCGTVGDLLRQHGAEFFTIEKAQAMRKGGRRQGVASTAVTVGNQKLLVGVAKGLGIPVYEVHPQTWKARVLAGTLKDKAAAVAYVRSAFPYVSLFLKNSRVPHDGIADAICIGVYAYREFKERGGNA